MKSVLAAWVSQISGSGADLALPLFRRKLFSQHALFLSSGKLVFALVLSRGLKTGNSPALTGLEVPFTL